MEDFKLNTIEEAIADFREGKFIIVVDDEDRENEGDFIIAAEKITPGKSELHAKRRSRCAMAPLLHWSVAPSWNLKNKLVTIPLY